MTDTARGADGAGTNGTLWCMHIAGPDDVHAAPDFWTALAWSAELNAAVAARAIKQGWAGDDNWPLAQATVQRWPWSAEGHADSLATELAARAAQKATPAPAATPGVPDSLREAIKRLDEIREEETKSLHSGDGMRLYRIIPQQSHAMDLALEYVRALIAAQPAGQAGDAGVVSAPQRVERPFAYCCNMDPATCDCANPNHGTALFEVKQSAPNSTRTGAAETGAAIRELVAEIDGVTGDLPFRSIKPAWLVDLAGRLGAVADAIEGGDNASSDPVIRAVREDLLSRSQVGIKKYGRTLAREDLSSADWLQHAYEEALDQAAYLKAAVLAARPEAPSDAGWSFDMEAAPRDGTPINVGRDNGCGWDLLVVWWSKSATEYPWHTEGGGEYPEHRFDCWATLTPPSDPAPSGQADTFPKPRRKDGEPPCGECHLHAGETCDICGAVAPPAPSGQAEG